MKSSIYTEVLRAVLALIDEYVSGGIDLERYQSELFKAENEIASVEEKELRALFQNHENELELIRFTTDDRGAMLREVSEFRGQLSLWL